VPLKPLVAQADLSHAQRQTLGHRLEAGLRLLDEHCRVYQYLLKRTIAPIVSAPCPQPIAHEAIQGRAAYLNARRDELYDLSLYSATTNAVPVTLSIVTIKPPKHWPNQGATTYARP